MNQDKERIWKLLEEGKITAEEAEDLLYAASSYGGDGCCGDKKEKSKPWYHILLGTFVLMLAIATGAVLLYCLFFYLPFHLPIEKMAIVYGLLAIIVLCITLGWVVMMNVGRKFVSAKFKGTKEDEERKNSLTKKAAE